MTVFNAVGLFSNVDWSPLVSFTDFGNLFLPLVTSRTIEKAEHKLIPQPSRKRTQKTCLPADRGQQKHLWVWRAAQMSVFTWLLPINNKYQIIISQEHQLLMLIFLFLPQHPSKAQSCYCCLLAAMTWDKLYNFSGIVSTMGKWP